MKEIYKVLPHPAADARLLADRHTLTLFPAAKFDSREDVERRREELQFNLRMAAGLYPWPEKTPLNTQYEHVGDYEGYSIKKVMFESRPGFWSTGNLYLPRPMEEKAPAIFVVIGHWDEQRLASNAAANYPQQLANFARMGFICLVTDMVGMLDSRQVSHEYGRGEKELWQSNGLGIQLWNNIRALDLLCSMPEVDAENIGMTGSSGGGSQTLFLSLVDDRIKAAAPINMISRMMQGGCQCENCAGLRRFTENSEMCAMLAPRPLFMAGSTGDWTRDLETLEYPAMLETYRQYGAENMVERYFQIAGHQYNHKTRHRVYSFFERHLMGKDRGWIEQSIEIENPDALRWFPGGGHAPGINNDEEFFEAFKQERRTRIASLSAEEKRKMLAWVIGIDEGKWIMADGDFFEIDSIKVEKNIVTSTRRQQIPVIRLVPENWDGRRACLALGSGKDCVEHASVRKMLKDGIAVVSGDLFMTGEMAEEKKRIEGGEMAESYFTTFHYTTDAYRAQDVALLWQVASEGTEECSLWAEDVAARAAVCALPFLKNVKKATLEKAALDLSGDEAYYKECFIPGLLLMGGLEGCLQLAECETEFF